ncbi:hypothetical protein [Ancylobacter mangrovi]|uniref:Uncharacterized protein n=1 Tax=Ancylobacter mangrovi TaxID=2972472 RepID=A0A9X2T058_9HYPH|nr:hypothetical protein [Ancylobacter mangrovi]MCS0493505.1 hypothetical protein [Ancylobacter mangrovi]MCS0501877.1 hypothetical protein [Ancylobacter mangrovi]
MKKLIIAAAAAGTLGLSAAAANADVIVDSYGNPVVVERQMVPQHAPVIIEGRNVAVPQQGPTGTYYRGYPNPVPDWYRPGVEPYIGKQIEQDHKGG